MAYQRLLIPVLLPNPHRTHETHPPAPFYNLSNGMQKALFLANPMNPRNKRASHDVAGTPKADDSIELLRKNSAPVSLLLALEQ